jgi:hypothetical protein
MVFHVPVTEICIILHYYNENDVDAAREYIETMLDLILYSHGLYVQMTDAHEHGKEEHKEHKH